MNTLRDKIEESIKKYDSDCWDYPLTDNNKVLADNFQSIAEDFAVKFAEWVESKYLLVWHGEKSGWVDYTENEILLNGSDYHKEQLLKISKTTTELKDYFRDFVYSPNIKEGENKNS